MGPRPTGEVACGWLTSVQQLSRWNHHVENKIIIEDLVGFTLNHYLKQELIFVKLWLSLLNLREDPEIGVVGPTTHRCNFI